MESSIPSNTRKESARGPEPEVSIWVIDDNRALSLALANIIEIIAGFPCTRCYESADAALEALAEGTGHPDVIFLDVQMPGINGLDAINPLKQAVQNCKVYMVTATDTDWHRRTALDRGADGYFLKLDITKEVLTDILGKSVPELIAKSTETKSR